MKVEAAKSQIQQNKGELKKLIRSQRDQITNRQQEIKNIEKIYDKKKENQRFQGEVELMDIQHRDLNRLQEASVGQEEKLEEIKKQVTNTQERLIKEEINLKKGHGEKVKNLNTNHSERAQDIFERSQDEIKNLSYDINKKVKNVHHNSDQTMEKIRQKSKLAIDKVAHENGLKVTQAQSGQANELKSAEERFQATIRQNEINHKNTMAKQQLVNQSDFLTRERIHKDRTNASEVHYGELLRGEKEAFESKYKVMIGEHQAVLDRLEGKLDERFNQTIADKASTFKSLETEQADSFYNLKTLEPTIREDESNYFVDILVSPHEKENYNLTADKRTVRISFNRRSEKRLDAPSGEVESSRKSETITKEFKVAQIVDDKDLKVAYKDGVLSYRLPKA